MVAGGGAAGFFCAVNAARLDPTLSVVLLEKTSKLLSKVRISGGGRCNVTHACFDNNQLIKKYPRGEKFLQKTFRHFAPVDTVTWFEERGVELKTEPDGRMFPVTDDSATIIQCLLKEADRYRVEIRMSEEIRSLEKKGERWFIQTNRSVMNADLVCIACGGFAKSEQFHWLTALGHGYEEPVPSLFTFNAPKHPITTLMGVTVPEVQVKIPGTKLAENGPLLITHWGLSGPVVLRLSAWGARELASRHWQFSIVVNWLPAFHENSLRTFFQAFRQEKGNQKLKNANPFQLPQRLWDYFLETVETDAERRWADLPAKDQNRLAKLLTAQGFEISGKTTFKEEFVTAGGIKLGEINPDTMGSRLQPDLFFAGEIMDVDGITGGFNFQHAWTTGMIAARATAKRR